MEVCLFPIIVYPDETPAIVSVALLIVPVADITICTAKVTTAQGAFVLELKLRVYGPLPETEPVILSVHSEPPVGVYLYSNVGKALVLPLS